MGTSFTTGGLTWTKVIPMAPDGGRILADAMYFVVAHDDPRVMYFETQYMGIYKSLDGGRTSREAFAGLQGSAPRTGVIAMDPGDARIPVHGNDHGVHDSRRMRDPVETSQRGHAIAAQRDRHRAPRHAAYLRRDRQHVLPDRPGSDLQERQRVRGIAGRELDRAHRAPSQRAAGDGHCSRSGGQGSRRGRLWFCGTDVVR